MCARLKKALTNIVPFDKQIIIAHFNGNPATTVIVHYSPVEGDCAAEEHYNNLSTAIKDIPKHNVLLVVGDYNAHFGPEDVKFTFHNSTNKNGEYTLNLAQEENLSIINTRFRKKKGKLWTFLSDGTHHKSQIDYILINKKWVNSVKNVEAYNIFSSLGTDYRVITAKIRLSLRMSSAPKRRKVYDWDLLKTDSKLQETYTKTISNKYQELNSSYTLDATEKYKNFIRANDETGEMLMPVKERRKSDNIQEKDNIVMARNKVRTAYDKYQANTNEINYQALRMEKNSLIDLYNAEYEKEFENLIHNAEQSSRSNPRECWKIINDISGRNKSKKGKLAENSKEERINNWLKHFKDLLGKAPIVDGEGDEIPTIYEEINIKEGAFTMDEFKKVKFKITENKAAGPDRIAPEVLKRCDIDNILLEFFVTMPVKTFKKDIISYLQSL